nr:PsbP-related protein [uncultured Methanobacterium sp.]
MENSDFWQIGLLGIVICVVFLSGCITSQDVNQNSQDLDQIFSQNGLTFNYPNDWFNVTNDSNEVNGHSPYVIGVFNSPNNVNLQVSQYNLSSSTNATIEGLKDSTLEGIKNNINYNSAEFISDSKTTINGNVIYEITYTEKNLGAFLFIFSVVDEYKSLLVITGKDRHVYI